MVGLWLGSHALLRLWLGATLGMDDAEQALSAQAWSWGYRTEQPPLFTWMLLLLEPLFGQGILPITILRYGFLALFCFAFWHAAKAWLGDNRRAALALSALPAIYTFGWYAQVDLTHSTVLAAAMSVLLWLAARFTRTPAWSDYLLLGLTVGLGMLGKWNFVMAGAGFAVTALLLLPELRRALLHPGTLLAILLAVVIVLPNALWVLDHKSVEAAGAAVLIREPISRLESVLDLGKAMVAFPQPWLVLALLLFWPMLRRRVQAGPFTRPPLRVLGTYVLVTIALHALLVLPFGGVDFSERWMIVPFLPLPILFAALFDPDDLPIGRWLVVAAVLVLVTLGLRLGIQLGGGDRCSGRCRTLMPFAELSAALSSAGFKSGTIVTDDLHLGGNMRVRFPESRVVDMTAPPGVFGPPKGDGQCLLVWNSQPERTTPPARLAEGAAAALGVDLGKPSSVGTVMALYPGAIHKRLSLGYVLFARPNGECR
jgi:4-amino-4-deoxy-L-arabinose transferase-like glycosyltransferase